MNIETMDTEEIDLKELYISPALEISSLDDDSCLGSIGICFLRVLKPIYKAETTLFARRRRQSNCWH